MIRERPDRSYILQKVQTSYSSAGRCVDLSIISTYFPVVDEVPTQADHSMPFKVNCAQDIRDMTPLDCNGSK